MAANALVVVGPLAIAQSSRSGTGYEYLAISNAESGGPLSTRNPCSCNSPGLGGRFRPSRQVLNPCGAVRGHVVL